ncbi:MAG: DUF4350 domain-containing protein [Flavobacteriales bacterium]|nr:DUF4350 domain-containing protein [Flavobacteriales bacterium]
MMQPRSLALVTGSMLCLIGAAQQIPDSAFTYQSRTPAYPKGQGPVVVLDEAHFNFHTLGGRYYAFGKVLENDGYVIRPGTEDLTLPYLEEARILVISNALSGDGSWQLPTADAFTKEEAEVVRAWVHNGGGLFLIADHMPFAGAAARLGLIFGVNWINGYAVRKDRAPEFFSRKAGTLTTNPITDGGGVLERIDSVQTFTGSAFLVPPEAIPITRLKDDYEILLPTTAGQFNDSTAYVDGSYFTNGAMLSFGKGRVVFFGEAAMFSAQLQGPDRLPMGMNQPGSEQNPQLLLNVIHWLDRRL